ncbi:SRPBCC family protein [Streptomyces sp. NPDC047061]|uniref:SRPBCC family protein n=1 Tax=Streptomyces sp. NPDC047061 TaxID=3154605 RepID=UPI003408A395
MRHVKVDTSVAAARADEVFDAVLRWELPDPDSGSDWAWESGVASPESGTAPSGPDTAFSAPVLARRVRGIRARRLEFPSGTLRWSEEIVGHRDGLRISFAQTEGDFAAFHGQWTVHQDVEAVVLRFEAAFDFGVESMAGILDPIAEQAVRDTVGRAVTGMFDSAEFQA